jgi:hypothetical protein
MLRPCRQAKAACIPIVRCRGAASHSTESRAVRWDAQAHQRPRVSVRVLSWLMGIARKVRICVLVTAHFDPFAFDGDPERWHGGTRLLVPVTGATPPRKRLDHHRADCWDGGAAWRNERTTLGGRAGQPGLSFFTAACSLTQALVTLPRGANKVAYGGWRRDAGRLAGAVVAASGNFGGYRRQLVQDRVMTGFFVRP